MRRTLGDFKDIVEQLVRFFVEAVAGVRSKLRRRISKELLWLLESRPALIDMAGECFLQELRRRGLRPIDKTPPETELRAALRACGHSMHRAFNDREGVA